MPSDILISEEWQITQ